MSETDLIFALRSLDEPVEPSDEQREAIWEPLAARLESEGSHRRLNQTDRPTLWGGLRTMAVAAVLVLIVGIGAVLITSGVDSPVADPGTRVPVPDSHPAARLVAEGTPSYESAVDALTDALVTSGHPFLCGLSAVSDWRLCLVYADGVLAAITFDNPPDTVARIAGDGLDGEVTVPINGSQLIGFASSGGEIRRIVERDGEHAGGGTGMGTNPERS